MLEPKEFHYLYVLTAGVKKKTEKLKKGKLDVILITIPCLLL